MLLLISKPLQIISVMLELLFSGFVRKLVPSEQSIICIAL